MDGWQQERPFLRLTSDAAIVALAFSRDGTILAAGSRDGSVMAWDLGTGQPLFDAPGHSQVESSEAK